MERFHRQLSSVFQFKSRRVWAGRRMCLGRKPVDHLEMKTILKGGDLAIRKCAANIRRFLKEFSVLMPSYQCILRK